MTERLHFHFSLSCIGEGNGNPIQCSCLENPRDGGAWWAAISGVAQSQTRLKRLSSSSVSSQRRQRHPTPVRLPGKSHGWRSLAGYSPWGHKESDTTGRLHFLSLLLNIISLLKFLLRISLRITPIRVYGTPDFTLILLSQRMQI